MAPTPLTLRGADVHGGRAVGDAAAGRPRSHDVLAPHDEHARAPQGAGRAASSWAAPTAARCCRRCSRSTWRRASARSRRSRSRSARRRPPRGSSYDGAALPIIPALALKATLTNPAGPLANLQALRDQTLGQLYDLYKTGATPAQQTYIDSLVTSQTQVRSINQTLLDALTSIKDNTADSQMLAAVTLIQMKVTPVISMHIPFGGDNHRDIGLAAETAQTVAGVATIASLMAQLATAGLADAVTFATLNVFGRTLGPGNTDGRQHNENHQVSVTIGKPFAGGVIGGVGPVGKDYGALADRLEDGQGAPPAATSRRSRRCRRSAARCCRAVGVDKATVDTEIIGGTVIGAALV